MECMRNFQDFITVWQALAQEKRPIVLYGMGDGAEKILREFAKHHITAAAIFASDEFVRGHSFAGFRVQRLSEIIEQYGEDIVIVIAFASQRAEVLAKMEALNEKYTVYAPDVPVVGGGLFDDVFVRQNADKLDAAYALLADDTSRSVFENMVAFKLTGQINYLRDAASDKQEAFNHILQPTQAEHFVDLGAYNGDTIRELLSFTDGKFASITALEPDRKNAAKLLRYIQQNLQGEITIVQAGAWHEDTVQTFAGKAGRNSAVSSTGLETQMRSVDSVLQGKPCTMIKMDVEGAERAALCGARQTIQACLPKLNIAAYHRNEDLFDLPLLIHELAPDYHIYLRHHPYIPCWDTNLYARTAGVE